VIQLPCVKNAILLFCFFSLQFRRHAINCRLSSTCCNLYWNSYFRLLHHSYHLSSVSFPRRCPSSSIKNGGEWSFKLRRPNVQRRSRPPAVIYPATTYRLLPLVASNIRVMTSFDAVIKGERSSLLSLGKLHQQCHVVFIYSTAGPFQLASSTNGVAPHLSWGWKCSTERRSRYRGAPGDHSWIMVDDRVNKGNILVKNVILKAKVATRYVTF
jgi:hypothetical protein